MKSVSKFFCVETFFIHWLKNSLFTDILNYIETEFDWIYFKCRKKTENTLNNFNKVIFEFPL